MKRILPTLIYCMSVSIALAVPFAMVYASTIIPCTNDCTFAKLFELVSNVVHFLLFDLAVPLAAIAFAWAGGLLLTDGGSESRRTKARGIMLYAGLGLAFALAAWLIVNTIFSTLSNIQL